MSQKINCWVFFVSLRHLEIFIPFPKNCICLWTQKIRDYTIWKRYCALRMWKILKDTHCAIRTAAAAALLPFALFREEAGSRDAHVGVLCYSLELGHAFGWEIPCCAGAWDHEWLRQSKRKMLWLCTSKVSSIVLKYRRRGSVCHLPSQRCNQEGLSLSSTNLLQPFLMYNSLGILDLCLFNTRGCMLWRKPLVDASFFSPSEVLQEVHTDLIFLPMISL